MTESFKAALVSYTEAALGLEPKDRAHLQRWSDDDRADEEWQTIDRAAHKHGLLIPPNVFIREILGRVDGFDQDEAESKRDERAVILRRLLASKCDTLEAFELADRLFDACPCLVECFRKEGGHILGVGSIRDCRTYSALARGVAI